MMKTFTQLAGFFTLILNGALLMAQPAMIKDIHIGPIGSSPDILMNGNGVMFFIADDGPYGVELWKTDGTAAGTLMVADINPGINSSFPNNLSLFNNEVYFFADDQVHGKELWKSDGTEAGTVLVKDINEGVADSRGDYLTPISGYLTFSATNGTTAGLNGVELWRTDGTEAGTFMIKDINPGIGDSYPTGNISGAMTSSRFVRIGSTFFFTVDNGTNGRELWKSNGTVEGTVMIKDINVGAASSSPGDFTVLSSVIYFSAFSDVTVGAELWKTDGTEEGTVLVKDINPTGSAGPRQLTNVNGTLFFTAMDGVHGEEVWKTDGTVAGTSLIADINPGADGCSPIINLRSGAPSALYFRATNGTNGRELWKTDGSSTMMLKDINPGSSESLPYYFFTLGTKTYFAADNGVNGVEMWQTDGTDLGTSMVADINLGSNGCVPTYMTSFGGTMLFFADDGTNGKELWALDPSVFVANEPYLDVATKQVSPNPTAGAVTITGVKETEVLMVYNSVGVLINSYQGQETVHVDLTAETNGIYIVRSSEGGFLKIVKQ